jgi:hypothetical protein
LSKQNSGKEPSASYIVPRIRHDHGVGAQVRAGAAIDQRGSLLNGLSGNNIERHIMKITTIRRITNGIFMFRYLYQGSQKAILGSFLEFSLFQKVSENSRVAPQVILYDLWY